MTIEERGRQQLIDHLPVVVFEYTFFPDGGRDFTYISPRCEELIGLNPEIVMRGHLSMSNFIHPSDLPSFSKSVEESMNHMTEWKWQGRCKGIRGFVWLEAQGIPSQSQDGRIVFTGVFSDISDRKRLEQQQIESERRYRDLVEKLPLGIVIHAKGKILFANDVAASIVGASGAEALIGMEPMRFVHPDSAGMVKDRVDEILKGNSTPPLEEKFVRLDGKVVYVEASGYPFSFGSEPAVEVIFRDITNQKTAEASFRKTEKLFYQLFQNTPMAVTLLNEEGNVVQINRGFEEMFGFAIEELEGKSLNQFIVPDDLESEGNEINNLISNNRIVRMETVRYRKDKTMLSVIIYGVPVLLQDQTIGIFGMYVDITERRKIEEELKVRNTELDNFVYKVSHDLRAPLSSVLGLAHLAGLPGNDDNLLEYIRLMGQKAAQLDHFISDVLSHSKNLKMELKIERVDFGEIIGQNFNDLNYLRGVEEVEKVISIDAPDFYSDPWRIAEIFRNLMSNAIKYRKLSESGTRITIAVKADERQCTINFQDNGIGIDKTSLDKIFEMFYRASNQSEGSGLGLYIVKNAVDKLGGRVNVESELGKGTAFKITLPNQRLSK